MNFEDLPNEIFYELFEYLDVYDLYRTFSKLNSRIDLLIRNFRRLQIILHSIEDLDHPINRYFLPQTPTLIINHSKQFFDPFKHSFPSIRCLTLLKPARVQWDSIQSTAFPNLQRLYLINSVFAYHTEQICRLLFSNEFTCLHTCSLPYVAYEENNQWTGAPILRSLEANIWDIRVYQQILEACPNLVRLKMEFIGGHNQEKLSISDSDKQHSNLQYLSFHCSIAITCELIDAILSFVPNLQQFSLNATYRQPSHIPLDALAVILQNRIPSLTRINLDITLPKSLCHEEKLNTNYLLFKSYEIRSSRLIIVGSL